LRGAGIATVSRLWPSPWDRRNGNVPEVIMYDKRSLMVVFMSVVALGLATSALCLATDRVADSEITAWVQAALRRDERIDAPRIIVDTNDGIVTLTGDVGTLVAKQYADREAKKINGVVGVINQITVVPGVRSDPWDEWYSKGAYQHETHEELGPGSHAEYFDALR
jgi:BON domain